MLLIKFMFTLIYYGSFIYTVYKVRQIQQEYSDIMALYKQERERTFPNLTEQEQKKRKKAISQYYEKKDPSFALKRKFSFIIYVIVFFILERVIHYFFPIEDVPKNLNYIIPYLGIALTISAVTGFYLIKSKKKEREIFKQYLIDHPKNELQFVWVSEKLQASFRQNTNKRFIVHLTLGILMILYPLFFLDESIH